MRTIACLLTIIWLAFPAGAQVVEVTASFDATNLTVGATAILRVFAQVTGSRRLDADQILSWYVDLVNLTPTVARANYTTLQKTFSDSDPRTSSAGKIEGNNLRGIYDTFLNLAGAGTTNRVELFNCAVTASATGKVSFAISAGTTVTNLSTDFLVAPKADSDPLTGGIYSKAKAELVVKSGTSGTNTVKLQIGYSRLTGALSNRVALSFTAAPGNNYFLEYQNKLAAPPVWQVLPGGPHNSGSYVDTNSFPTRFYRVRTGP